MKRAKQKKKQKKSTKTKKSKERHYLSFTGVWLNLIKKVIKGSWLRKSHFLTLFNSLLWVSGFCVPPQWSVVHMWNTRMLW